MLINKKNWWVHFMIIAAISLAGLLYLGRVTYTGAPPYDVDFTSSTGQTVISAEQISHGEAIFHLRGLMDWGTFMGDGSERGPDFTADSLHRTFLGMQTFYADELMARAGQNIPLTQYDQDAIDARIRRELHNNTYDEEAGRITLTDAQISVIPVDRTLHTDVQRSPLSRRVAI
jgi:nitric oxide reductase subunit B